MKGEESRTFRKAQADSTEHGLVVVAARVDPEEYSSGSLELRQPRLPFAALEPPLGGNAERVTGLGREADGRDGLLGR